MGDGEGNGTPLQYSCLENPMDGGAWKAEVHGVAEGRTWLSDSTFTFHFPALERKWQPTPVFLPGESQGRGSLVGCRLWGRTRLKWLSSSSSVCLHFLSSPVDSAPAIHPHSQVLLSHYLHFTASAHCHIFCTIDKSKKIITLLLLYLSFKV